VVGNVSSITGTRAFRWSQATGMTLITDAPQGFAYGVSDAGNVVVGRVRPIPGQGINYAYLWSPGSGVVTLGDLPGGLTYSQANGVTPDGNIVAGFGSSAQGRQAVFWSDDVGMVGLGDLPGGAFESEGNAISADGRVIVGQGTTAAGIEAFRWTASGGMVSSQWIALAASMSSTPATNPRSKCVFMI
jgi:probable HAF family extracellular repeat protein